MCTLFANLYVLLTWDPHMVYMGTPYIFDIYMIRCGWLGIIIIIIIQNGPQCLAVRERLTPYQSEDCRGGYRNLATDFCSTMAT